MRHNRLLLILLALNIGISASSSQNVAYAQNIDSQSESSYFNNKWPGRAGMSEEVQAYALPNAGYIDVTGFKPEYYGLPKGSSGYAFLTRHFFERSGINVDHDYKDLSVLTYRYYQPKATQPADRLSRGGGRDVILMPTQDSQKLNGAIYTVKGSGTNARYSGTNGTFRLNDFRSNGLQTLSEALLEHIVMRQFEHNAQYGKYGSNSPVKGSKGIIILPIEVQQKIYGNSLEVSALATQTIRDQRVPRDSYFTTDNYEPQIPYEQKIKVSAYMFLWNIGHGAINLENMSQGINDPGHVTTGYPGLSSNYRCLLCNGLAGSRYDGTMVGILDYYFPTVPTVWPKALKNKTFTNNDEGKKITRDLTKEIFRALTGRNSIKLKLSDEEVTAFANIMNEKISESSSDFQDKIAAIGETLLDLDTDLPKDIFANVNTQYSLRFILQMAAIKYFAPDKTKSLFQQSIPEVFKDNKSAIKIIEVLYRFVSENNISPAELKSLMEEHLPVNVLQNRINYELNKLQKKYDQKIEMAELQKDINALIVRYTEPIPLAIAKYALYLRGKLSNKMSDSKLDRIFYEAVKNTDEKSLAFVIDKLSLKIDLDIDRIDEWIIALDKNYDKQFRESIGQLLRLRAKTFVPTETTYLSDKTISAILNLSEKNKDSNLVYWLVTSTKPILKKKFTLKVLEIIKNSDLPMDRRLLLFSSLPIQRNEESAKLLQIIMRSSLDKRDVESLIEFIRQKSDFIKYHNRLFEKALLRDILFFAVEEKNSDLLNSILLEVVPFQDLYLKPELFISTFYPPFKNSDKRVQKTATEALLGNVPETIVTHLFETNVERFYNAIGYALGSFLDKSESHSSLDPYLDVIIQAVWKTPSTEYYTYFSLAKNSKLMKRFNSKFRFFIESLLLTLQQVPSRFSESKILLKNLISAKKLTAKNKEIVQRLLGADSVEQMIEIAGLKTALTCVQPFSN